MIKRKPILNDFLKKKLIKWVWFIFKWVQCCSFFYFFFSFYFF